PRPPSTVTPTPITITLISFTRYGDHRNLHSFPTRRSSDLSRCQCTKQEQRSTIGRVPLTNKGPGVQALQGSNRTHWRQTARRTRSEEHTSELQSRENLVCRLLLEKKKKKKQNNKQTQDIKN